MEGQEAAETGTPAVAGSTPAPQAGSVFNLTKEQNAEAKPEAKPEAKGDAPAEAEADYEFPWLKDTAGGKFKKAADLAKAYEDFGKVHRMKTEEAKTLKGQVDSWAPHHGAPKDEEGNPLPYEIKPPDGVESVDPEVGEFFTKVGHRLDLKPEVLQEIAAEALPWFLGLEVGTRESAEKATREFFGGTPEAAEAGIAALEAWAGRLGFAGNEAAVDDFIECGKNPAAIRTLERLRAATSGSNIGRSAGAGAFGKEHYEALVAKSVSGNLTTAEQQQMVAYLNGQHPERQE